MNANAGSLFMAAREAVRGFDKLGAGGAGGTFIFTGNKLNVIDLPGVLVFGVGKAAAARLVQTASRAYREKGYKYVLNCCSLSLSLLPLVAVGSDSLIDSITPTSARQMEILCIWPGMARRMRSIILSWLRMRSRGLGCRRSWKAKATWILQRSMGCKRLVQRGQ